MAMARIARIVIMITPCQLLLVGSADLITKLESPNFTAKSTKNELPNVLATTITIPCNAVLARKAILGLPIICWKVAFGRARSELHQSSKYPRPLISMHFALSFIPEALYFLA